MVANYLVLQPAQMLEDAQKTDGAQPKAHKHPQADLKHLVVRLRGETVQTGHYRLEVLDATAEGGKLLVMAASACYL